MPSPVALKIDALRSKLDAETQSRAKNDLLLQIIELSKTVTNFSKELGPLLKPLIKCMRLMTVDKEQAIRAQSFRALRYIVTDEATIGELLQNNVHLFISRSLERDSKYLWERMQSLKLIRQIMAIEPGMLPRSIVMSLVAIAEHEKDDFRRVCLDALRELVLVNADVVASCNGTGTIVESILDPTCQDIAGSLTLTLLYLLDQESTRKYLRPSLDILKLLSVFTDTDSPNSPEKEAKRAAAHKALVTIMRSWTGILCFTSDPQGLRSLIQILTLPAAVKGASWAREAIFDFLFELMHVVKSEDLRLMTAKNMLRPKPGTVVRPNLLHSYIVMVMFALMDCGLVEILTNLGMSGDAEFSKVATNLLTELLRLSSDLLPRSLCATLNSLPSVVSQALQFGGKTVEDRVRALNMINGLSSHFLESTTYSDGMANSIELNPKLLGGEPSLVALAASGGVDNAPLRGREDSDFNAGKRGGGGGDGDNAPKMRSRTGVTFGMKLEKIAQKTDISRNYDRFNDTFKSGPAIPNASSNKSRVVQFMRHHMDATIDDLLLQALVKKTNVLAVKDFRQWDFNICLTLLEGPLTAPTALASVLKTKFCKRLLSFLKPDKRFFSDLDWSVPNQLYVKTACQLFRVMLSCAEGREYPFFQELLGNIFAALFLEIGKDPSKPSSGGGSGAGDTEDDALTPGRSPAIKPSSVNSTQSGVFSLLGGGKKQAHAGPVSSFRCFSRTHVARKLSREYFTLLGVVSSSAFGAIIFDRYNAFDVLYSMYKDTAHDYLTRLLLTNLDYATNKKARTLLETWVKSGSVDLRKCALSHMRLLYRASVDQFHQWGIGLLVSQLTHPLGEINLAALSVLEEAVEDETCLDTLIKKRPSFKEVRGAAHNLQLQFLSSKIGVDYLNSIDWIMPELSYWRVGGGNQRYVEALEHALVSALNSGLHSILPNLLPPVTLPGEAKEERPESASVAQAPPQQPQQPFPLAVSVRSEADDYHFERVHRLPFVVELVVEYRGGRQVQVNTVAYVHTEHNYTPDPSVITINSSGGSDDSRGVSPSDAPAPAADADPSVLQGSNNEPVVAGEEPQIDTQHTVWVEGVLLNAEGEPAGFYLEPDTVVRARLSIGAGVNGSMDAKPAMGVKEQPNKFYFPDASQAERVLLPKFRQNVSSSRNIVLQDRARWEFSASAVVEVPKEGQSVQKGDDKEQPTFLRKVSFKLPSLSTSMLSVMLPPHIYGEIAKTEDGCKLLRVAGHFKEFVDTIKSASKPSIEKRAALWAVGQIGSSVYGWELLSETDIVAFISDQAKNCQTLSMRGTCFYVLGLLSRIDKGRDALSKLGWAFSPNASVAVVIPAEVSAFLRVPVIPFAGSWASDKSNTFGVHEVPFKPAEGSGSSGATTAAAEKKAGGADEKKPEPPPPKKKAGDKMETLAEEILGHLSNLCNHVTQKNSLTDLRALHEKHRDVFRSPSLFFETFKMLTSYTYRLPARRFILFDLFNHITFDANTMAMFDSPFEKPLDLSALARHITERK